MMYQVVVSDVRVVNYNTIMDTDTDIVLNSSGLEPSLKPPVWAQRATYPIQSQVTVKLVADGHGNVINGNFIILPKILSTSTSPDPPPSGAGNTYQVVVTETRVITYLVSANTQSDLENIVSKLNPYDFVGLVPTLFQSDTFQSDTFCVVVSVMVKVTAPVFVMNTRVVEIITATGMQLVLS